MARRATAATARSWPRPTSPIADLIGEVDPIKVAEGRYLSDELTIHYGLLPRTNRGIFAINELPDLAERIQVGLLNIMEERDVQIRGYKVRLPLDLYVVASANPEDYTNRGRIITPLKDRFGSQIRTHYPRTIEHEIEIMEQERTPLRRRRASRPSCPEYMKEIVAEVTHLARAQPRHHPALGRLACASRSATTRTCWPTRSSAPIRLGESRWPSRASATSRALVASTGGKIELETVGDASEEKVVDKLVQRAVLNVFNRHFARRRAGRAWCSASRAACSIEVVGRDAVRGVHAPGRRGARRCRPPSRKLGARATRPRVAVGGGVRAGGAAPRPEAQQGRAGGPASGTGC